MVKEEIEKVCDALADVLTDYEYDCNVISDIVVEFKKKLSTL